LTVVVMVATTWLLWRFVRGVFARFGRSDHARLPVDSPLEARR
jgi:hypothetical protein